MKYLVSKTTWFFDGHGSDDEGGTEKFITSDKIYSFLKKDKYYWDEFDFWDKKATDEEIEEFIKEECERSKESLHEQDGYNCTAYTFKVKKIKDEEEEARIKQILKDYDKL